MTHDTWSTFAGGGGATSHVAGALGGGGAGGANLFTHSPRVGVVPLGALVARHARPPSSRETVALSDGREASAASAARFDGPLGRGARFQSKRTVLGATRGGGGGDGGSRKVHVRVHRGFSGVETLRPRAVSADSRGDGILGGAHRRGNDGSFGDEAARLAEFARAVSARARARHAQSARRRA